MKRSKLFASVLAAAAGLIGVANTATDAGSLTTRTRSSATAVQPQPTTKAPVTPPAAAAQTQNVRAGATVVQIPTWITATPRWAWVGRKAGGRFEYYCRRVGA